MPKKNPAQSYDSYEVITQEDTETGDMLIPIHTNLLKELGWKEGDDVDFSIDDKGRIILKKL